MLDNSQAGDAQEITNNIMKTIEQRIQQQRQDLDYDQIFTAYDDIVFPVSAEIKLYPDLQQAQARYDQFDREVVLTASKLDRVPVIGRLWRNARHQLHSIALFYVNRALAHEARVNNHLIQALIEFLEITQQQRRTAFKMQAEINALRAQLRE
jgi:hypothetical protein